jgi:1-acyl-sn-glycerol-3-phosphate acyltransferase
MLPRIITTIVGWAVAIFYRVERTGPKLASGPVLVTANHPNALVDPMVIFLTGGRQTRPLAKAPLFEQALVGTVLKGLGGLPVYRRQDDPALMHLNSRTFDAAIAALHRGEAVQIYPEGQSHSEPSLARIRTGAARIALMAEDQVGWSLGLHVQPVGLTYTRKHLFGGRVIASFGEPIPVSTFQDVYAADKREAARALTDAIRERLYGLTLNFERDDERELVEVAERLYAREKKLARPREREQMAARLPRLRRFAEGFARLAAEDPERSEVLRQSVKRYMRMVTVLGVTEGDVPAVYRPARVFGYALRQLAVLTLVLPVAALGAVFWLVPFLFTRVAAASMKPKLDQVATYKVSVALVAFPTWLAGATGALWFLFGWRVALAAAIAFPLTGLAVASWRQRQETVLEDLRVFTRARGARNGRVRLARHRTELVEEFDAIARAWRESVDA